MKWINILENGHPKEFGKYVVKVQTPSTIPSQQFEIQILIWNRETWQVPAHYNYSAGWPVRFWLDETEGQYIPLQLPEKGWIQEGKRLSFPVMDVNSLPGTGELHGPVVYPYTLEKENYWLISWQYSQGYGTTCTHNKMDMGLFDQHPADWYIQYILREEEKDRRGGPCDYNIIILSAIQVSREQWEKYKEEF